MRWDGDETGHGIADASAFAPGIRDLLAEMAESDWVTEAPDAHLLPHIRRACEADGSPWQLVSAELVDSIYVVTIRDTRAMSLGEIRRDLFAVVAEIAEPTTTIIQRERADAVEFDVTIGTLRRQGRWTKGHGHLVRFVVELA